jgi:myo-inositol 2-dehydrogenase/D-chiro-inositol 1-dehydrogenase
VGVALFGLGRAGQFHLNNISRHRESQLLYVIDSDVEKAKEISRIYNCKYSETGEEALSDPQVQAVIIATPTPTHYDYILKAVKAKKAIFSEKPVGFTLEEIDHVYQEAEKNGVILLCGFNRRFDLSWVKAQNSIASGKVGKPQIARSTARDSPVPTTEYLKTSHGFFHDSGVHDIDVLRWMLGEDPCEVYAKTHCYIERIGELGDVDTIIMLFQFPSGCVGTIDMSRKCEYGYDQRVEIFGDKGMVEVQNKPSTSCVVSSAEGVLHDNVMFSFPQRFEEAYFLELDYFLGVVIKGVTEGKELRVTHRDARNAFIIAEAAMASAKSGLPVKIKY